MVYFGIGEMDVSTTIIHCLPGNNCHVSKVKFHGQRKTVAHQGSILIIG